METYHGHVRTPNDAIILFEACRLGTLPRVQRRLSEKERQSIRSGSVFVWDEREAGMRRWTDGKSWSASRVSGSFLTYREMEGKRGGNNYGPPLGRAGKTPDSTKGSDSDMDGNGDEGPDGYRYKPDGLMKQSFSITTSAGNHLHLISYYSRSHPAAQTLIQPSNDPHLRHIKPVKGMYPESTVHESQNIPAVTRAPMQGAHPGYPGPPGHSYPRPTHPLAHSQTNQWASPPPSNGYGPPPYVPSTLPPPHPSNHAMPSLQYSQSLPPLSQPIMAPSAPAYNRHATPPLDPTTLPRPQPPLNHRHTSSSSSIPNSHAPVLPAPSPPRGAALARTPSAHGSRGPSPASTPPLAKIDPRLVAPSPLSQHNTLPGLKDENVQRAAREGSAATRTPSPPPARAAREWSGTPTSRSADTAPSSAGTIPSIGALMNGTTPAGAALDAWEARSRSTSRSPPHEGPQDIPHDKLGFREDIRALRVLDRAFKT